MQVVVKTELWLSPDPPVLQPGTLSSSRSLPRSLCNFITSNQCQASQAPRKDFLGSNQRTGLSTEAGDTSRERVPSLCKAEVVSMSVLKLEVSYESLCLLHSLGTQSEQAMPLPLKQGSPKAAGKVELRFPRVRATESPAHKCHCPVPFIVAERTPNSERGSFQKVAPKQGAGPDSGLC